MNEAHKENQSSQASATVEQLTAVPLEEQAGAVAQAGAPGETPSNVPDVTPDKPRKRGRPKGSKNKKTLAVEKTTIHTALREDTPVKHTSAAFASATSANADTLASEGFAASDDAKRVSSLNNQRITTRLPRRTTHTTISSQEKTGFRTGASRAPQTYERAMGFIADAGESAPAGSEGELSRARVAPRFERRPERFERGERVERPERFERPERSFERSLERAERADRAERSFDRADERTDRVERFAERPERPERFERPERTYERSERSSLLGDRSESRMRPALSKPTTRVYHQRQERVCTPSVSKEELSSAKVADLRTRAIELGIEVTGMKKAQLVDAIFEASSVAEGFLEVRGVLDILADGYGFLRTQGYLPSETDCYVSMSLIKRNKLRKGDYLVGQTRPARTNEKFAAIQKIISINGIALEQLSSRVRFADLTPVYPQERLVMEHGAQTITARVIDLVAPIGKGQRGLIVSPPKAGKTTILKDIAASISANNPEVKLLCLLVDERPEEVTDMQRSIKGEVISSTFDMPAENHIAVAEMVIERAKRMVEMGDDVVILLDSITRLARAYNLAQPASGRVLSGGVDSTALYPPKRFLGAARNIENGGSLTILASALVETGSKMDEVIFEEFKGTGNMELKLDRALADRRIFPAIDPVSSGTRKEELLLDVQLAPLVWALRRILANMSNTERAMDMLIKSLKQTNDNQEFLVRTARKAQQSKGEPVSL